VVLTASPHFGIETVFIWVIYILFIVEKLLTPVHWPTGWLSLESSSSWTFGRSAQTGLLDLVPEAPWLVHYAFHMAQSNATVECHLCQLHKTTTTTTIWTAVNDSKSPPRLINANIQINYMKDGLLKSLAVMKAPIRDQVFITCNAIRDSYDGCGHT